MTLPHAETEAGLISKAQHGDRHAYGELVRQHHPGVVNVVYRLCGDAELAQDAAQDAFIQAWLHLPSFRPGTSLRNWLYRIAVNAALDVIRRNAKTAAAAFDDLPLADPQTGPEDALLQNERARSVQTRSWHILWNYRTLWIFGFMLALAMGGSGGGNNSGYSASDSNRRQPGSEWRSDWEGLRGESFAEKMQDGFRQAGAELQKLQAQYPVEFRMVIAAVITAFIVFSLLGILTAVLRYVAETASIRMVDEYEQTGVKVGFRQGWKYGWSRASWRLFLVNFLVHIPALVLFVILGLVTWWIVASALSGARSALITSLIAGIGLAFLFIFITSILMVILYVLRDFAWRMVVLEEAGVMDSLGNAFGLVKRQWKNVGLMWLVMLGLKIAWNIAFFILVFPLLIVSILTAVGGLLVAIVPTLLTAGLASLLSAPDYWPWIFAAIIGLPLFGVVAFSPILLVSGWGLVYQSSVWTLTYRELKALEAVTPMAVEPIEA